MTIAQMMRALNQLEYKDWRFFLGVEGVPAQRRPWLQVQFVIDDAKDGLPTLHAGRKWMLSEHMTERLEGYDVVSPTLLPCLNP